jgi:hypothetical protein
MISRLERGQAPAAYPTREQSQSDRLRTMEWLLTFFAIN